MKLLGIGEIFTIALQNQDLQFRQEIRFGDGFSSLAHHHIQPYDIGEYIDPPDGEELAMLEVLLSYQPDTILDIGAGSGRVTHWLTQRGTNVLACETDPYCINYCLDHGIKQVHLGEIASIKQEFDACIVMGGGFPLRNEAAHPLEDISDFLAAVKAKVKPEGLCLIDFYSFTHPLFKPINGYKVAELRYHLGDAISEMEYYVYPSYEQLSALMVNLGFTEIHYIKKIHSSGDPDVYQNYTLWRSTGGKIAQDLSDDWSPHKDSRQNQRLS